MNRRGFLQVAGAVSAASMFAPGGRASAAASAPQRSEDAARGMPFPIVDTHVHFWDPANLRYPWVEGSALLNRAYLPEDYTAAVGSIAVERIVFVEAACQKGHAMDEVAWVARLAEQDRRIQGIVAAAPLEQGAEVKATLETLAQNPLVKGIRPGLPGQGEPPPAFIEGVQLLESVNFSCDLCGGHDRLPLMAEVARQCPAVRFMIDHIGVPNIKERQFDPWREHIRRLADLPNVWCKMSGVATAAGRERWTRDDLVLPIEHVLECFGFARTAFGSDWPVMLAATTYERWVETLAWVLRTRTAPELRQIFHGTAIGFYRL